MSAPDVQPVVNPGDQFVPGSTPVAQSSTGTEPIAQVVAPPAEPAPVVVTPPVVATVTDPAPVDPLEAAIEAGMAPAVAPEWDPKAKEAFKHFFGAEDPLAYKAEIETKLQQAEVVKGEYDKLAPLKAQFDGLTPAFLRAFQLAMEGKNQEGIDFLRGLPDGLLLDKEAKNIPSETLIPTYLGEKMSKDEFAQMKDPETDPEVVKALKAKEKYLRDIAADMHERERAGITEATQAKSKADAEGQQVYNQGVGKAFAHASNDPVLKTLLTPEVKQAVQTGQFLNEFVSEDGRAPAEDSVSRYLWAKHGREIAKAQYNVGYRKGKNEAMLEAASGLKGAPPIAGRTTGGDPPANTEEAVKEGIFSKMGMSTV